MPGGCSLAILRVTAAIPVEAAEQLAVEERTVAAAIVETRRRAQFVGGRIALKAALRATGASPEALQEPILRGARGEPLLRDTFAGSIAHKGRFVAAVGGSRTNVAGLGIDLERVERITPAFAARVANDDERAEARRLRIPMEVGTTCLFATKEAVYKAVSGPPTLEFDAIRVCLTQSIARFTLDGASRTAQLDIRLSEEWLLVTARLLTA